MGFKAYTLVLSGVAQRLSDVYGGSVGVRPSLTDLAYRQILLHVPDANSADVYVGMDNTVSSTNHAFHLDQPTVNVAHAPVSIGPFNAGPIKFSEIWVIGTANDKLTIGGVPY